MAYPDRLKRPCDIRRYHEADTSKAESRSDIQPQNDINILKVEDVDGSIISSSNIDIPKEKLSYEQSSLSNR